MDFLWDRDAARMQNKTFPPTETLRLAEIWRAERWDAFFKLLLLHGAAVCARKIDIAHGESLAQLPARQYSNCRSETIEQQPLWQLIDIVNHFDHKTTVVLHGLFSETKRKLAQVCKRKRCCLDHWSSTTEFAIVSLPTAW